MSKVEPEHSLTEAVEVFEETVWQVRTKGYRISDKPGNRREIERRLNMHEELVTALVNLLDRRCEDHVRAAQDAIAKAGGKS